MRVLVVVMVARVVYPGIMLLVEPTMALTVNLLYQDLVVEVPVQDSVEQLSESTFLQ
jgi:hypothetical protein